jgi:hypothetical protein
VEWKVVVYTDQFRERRVEALAGKAALRDDLSDAPDKVQMWLAVYRRARRVGAAAHEQADDVNSIVGACQGESSLVSLAPRLIDVGTSVEEGIGERHSGEITFSLGSLQPCEHFLEGHIFYEEMKLIYIAPGEDALAVGYRGVSAQPE